MLRANVLGRPAPVTIGLKSALAQAKASTVAPPRAFVTPKFQSQAVRLSGGPGWDIEGVGHAADLGELATLLNANPSANVTMLGDYDASFDSVTDCVVLSHFTGDFNGGGHALTNLHIVSTRNDQPSPFPPGIGFFAWVDTGAVVHDFSISGRIDQLGARLVPSPGPAQIMVYRVGLIAGYNHGTIRDCTYNSTVFINGNLGYNGAAVGDHREDGFLQRVSGYGYLSCTVDAYNTYMSGLVAVCRGPMDDCHVLGGTIFAPSGTTNYVTLQTFDPVNPTTGSWASGLMGQVGYYTGDTAVAVITNCTVNNFTITNSVNNVVANYTGGIGAIFLSATVTDCSATNLTLSGGGSMGGAFGQMRNGQEGVDPDASIAKRITVQGTISGQWAFLGGFVGSGTGTITGCVANVNVSGVNNGTGSGDSGAFIGGAQATANISHCVATGTVNGATGNGGFFGWKNASAVIDQCLSAGPAAGSSAVGTFGGFDNGDTNVTNCYVVSDTATSGRLMGSVASPAGTAHKTVTELRGVVPGFDSDWSRDSTHAIFNGLPYYTANPQRPVYPTPQTFLYQFIADTDTSPITIKTALVGKSARVITWGRGGNGANGTSLASGGGGGSGAKAEKSGVVLGATEAFQIGNSGNAEVTWFRTSSFLVADYGRNASGSTNGAGGSILSCVGSALLGGGNGGLATTGSSRAGGGGAGAPGLNGAGQNGGNGSGNSSAGTGGGGGSADGGADGVAGNAGTNGGAGGGSFDYSPSITASFTATIDDGSGSAGTIMHVSAISAGSVQQNMTVTGSGVTSTLILQQLSGDPGSTGDYLIDVSQLVSTDTAMTGTTPNGVVAGGAGATSTAAPGSDGASGSGGGGGFGNSSAASAGGKGSEVVIATVDGVVVGPASGGGGGGGKDSGTTGANGGDPGPGLAAGGAGGGRGTTPGTGSSGRPGGILIIVSP